ncbi:MAG: hypothetical protein NXY59_05885 [Aigarchaeota archaeon]|nr:hypothetical protein [Candidatus Pelearchaeum maunauluense]
MEVIVPSRKTVLIFLGLSFLSIAGAVQSYAFGDDVPCVEKPPLYDALRPYGFWFPWIIFTAPLHVAAALICGSGDLCIQLLSSFPSMGAVKFPLASVLYSSAAACWVVYSWRRWCVAAPRDTRILLLLVPLAPALFLGRPSIPTIIVFPLFVVSTFLLLYGVFIVYSVAIYGLFRGVRALF